VRRISITERLVQAKDGYRQGIAIGIAVGFFLGQLPVPVFGFVVLGTACSYCVYQIAKWALEN